MLIYFFELLQDLATDQTIIIICKRGVRLIEFVDDLSFWLEVQEAHFGFNWLLFFFIITALKEIILAVEVISFEQDQLWFTFGEDQGITLLIKIFPCFFMELRLKILNPFLMSFLAFNQGQVFVFEGLDLFFQEFCVLVG